jgi:hypothetical protein
VGNKRFLSSPKAMADNKSTRRGALIWRGQGQSK